MKLRILIAILSFMLLGCTTQNTSGSNDYEDAESYAENIIATNTANTDSWSGLYSGNIDGKYPIVMRIRENNDKIEGYYFYESTGQDMEISGQKISSKQIELNEINHKGKVTGTFKGLIDGKNFSGTWTNADGSKKLPFELSPYSFSNKCSSVSISEVKDKDIYEEIVLPQLITENLNLKKRFAYLFSLKQLTGYTKDEILEEMKFSEEEQLNSGFLEFSTSVSFPQTGILSVSTLSVFMGAHESYSQNYLNFHLEKGIVLEINDIIKPEKKAELSSLCNKKLQESLKEAKEEFKNEGDEILELYEGYEFTEAHLNYFELTKEGITFHYFFDFPHLFMPYEPLSYFKINGDEIKPFLKENSPFNLD